MPGGTTIQQTIQQPLVTERYIIKIKVLTIQAQWKRAWVEGAKINESGIGLPSSDYTDERKKQTNKQYLVYFSLVSLHTVVVSNMVKQGRKGLAPR
jgi:hypothetical protein